MSMEDQRLWEAMQAAKTVTGCDISMDVAREEATWYSVMNTIALSLGSGMGRAFDQAGMQDMLNWAGINPDDLPQKNPQPLLAIFKSGDPHLSKDFDQWDLETWRWPADSFDRTLVPQAQAWAMIAETECAKWFAMVQSNEAIPGAMQDAWKAYGMLFWALAQKQCDFAFSNLRNGHGLFCRAVNPGDLSIIEDGTDLADQVCMLWACADIAAVSAQSDSMYANDDSRRHFIGLADDLFRAIADNKDDLLRDSSNAILAQCMAVSALIWYASTSAAQDLKARCFWLIREFADNLVKAQDQNEMVGTTLVDAAAALRALTDAFRITRLRTYAESATKVFSFMESQWYVRDGLYALNPQASSYTYNADDIGIILGALNAGRLFLGDRIDREIADLRMRVFFCKAVNMSGLQMSMPSPSFMPDWLQQREPDVHFRYGTIPLPNMAGDRFGIAPVMTGEVGYDPQKLTWDRRMLFDTPSAMHVCCDLLWLNHDAINGFPDVRLDQAPTAVQEAAQGSTGDAAQQASMARDMQYQVDGMVEG